MQEQATLGPREKRILDFVQQRTGLHIRRVQHTHAVTAINRAMKQAGASDPGAYVARLERDLAALDALIVELVVGETYFFRFPSQFRFLTETILPEVASRRNQRSAMRFWSAGCATGEEAYSLAIVLREAGLLERSHILATDISKPALETARRGIYHDWALRGDGRSRVEPHATRRDDALHLTSEIRQAVHFAYVNLALDVYPTLASGTGHQDVIFCRNVLIYLDSAAVAQVAERLFECLAPGGWLITAASDPTLDHHAPFETVETTAGVFYRRPALPSIHVDASRSCDSLRRSTAVPVATSRPQVSHTDPRSTVDLARAALSAGQYERAAELTATMTEHERAACLHVKALANTDTDLAQAACENILARHPLSPELHYLHAILLMEQRRDDKALAMIRRVLFLDRSQVMAHVTLGTLLRRGGESTEACRAFRNARDLCRAEDSERHVPLTEDETFGSVCRSAETQLASLCEGTEAKR